MVKRKFAIPGDPFPWRKTIQKIQTKKPGEKNYIPGRNENVDKYLLLPTWEYVIPPEEFKKYKFNLKRLVTYHRWGELRRRDYYKFLFTRYYYIKAKEKAERKAKRFTIADKKKVYTEVGILPPNTGGLKGYDYPFRRRILKVRKVMLENTYDPTKPTRWLYEKFNLEVDLIWRKSYKHFFYFYLDLVEKTIRDRPECKGQKLVFTRKNPFEWYFPQNVELILPHEEKKRKYKLHQMFYDAIEGSLREQYKTRKKPIKISSIWDDKTKSID